MTFSFTYCTCLGENEKCFLCGGKGFVTDEDRRSEQADRQRVMREGSWRPHDVQFGAKEGSKKPGASARTVLKSIIVGASKAKKRGYFKLFPHLAGAKEIEVSQEITLEADRSGSERIIKVRIVAVSEYIRPASKPGRNKPKQRKASQPVKRPGSRMKAASTAKRARNVRVGKVRTGKERTAERRPDGALQEALAAVGFDAFPEQRHTEHDATRDYARIRDGGRFGSHPSHDDHDGK